jgi:lauroyl/myristoyl acyltransferase
VLCLPAEGGRYRIWVGPNLAEGLAEADEATCVREVATRANRVLEEVIRARPAAWNWTLKRFKSRPTRELGPYPAYSRWDPDEEPIG